MSSKSSELHFVLIPLFFPGHQIPMVDMGRVLAQHGVTVTIVTTPLNAIRFRTIIENDIASGSQIRLLQLRFPCTEASLPERCENIDALPSRLLARNFMDAIGMLRQPIEQFMVETKPKPICIISDRNLPWTFDMAQKFDIPRLAFDGTSCFTVLCSHFINLSKIHETVSNDREPFVVPGLPDRIELTKSQLPEEFNPGPLASKHLNEHKRVADMGSYGLVVNSFEELEAKYVESYKKARGNKIWCIGSLSNCNKGKPDMARRGNDVVSVDETQCLQWLDPWPENSVVYACLGTLSCVEPIQLVELAIALESSKRPFIWVLREGYKSNEFKKWLYQENFEERIRGKGLLIHGWAPQLSILSHKAIGGFLTHCGWNSVLEGISAGLPMITWPLLAEQFFNEKLVASVLGIGEKVGSEIAMKWGEEEKHGVMVMKEQIVGAIDKVMDGEMMRKRGMEFGELASKAFGNNGSSYLNVKRLIQDIKQISGKKLGEA
ncbi:putative Tetratricopeptide repeat-like superfamily protein [Hibiscus syriacus]|uniref:Glycosyltransferase n=1 Tax=Hibiscus syriacus TaxID=106335 RepID=A0A6A2YZU6_HIBSY|nr:UDP-glycosyltransferase 73C4-like [Hibiscus syriacus]KAE8684833.1 putative Tetratricopeptide repeat-like superfamily protein [Hibiscus syriacus]